jgi:hypothetical protein
MKFNDVSFPHPVLGVGDAVKSKFGLNPIPVISPSVESYSITVTCEHDNDDLTALVNSGQAEYFCEATCSNTLYRKIITSNSSVIKLEIPKKQVKGKVFFTCVLVAKSPITNYQNRKSHPDYNGYSFDIETGDVLAFFGEFNFNADINYQKLKAVSSFMEVVENRDDKAIYTNVDLNKSKIEVQLPSEDYKLFANDSISKEPKFAPIFHSSIVLNALLIALYNFESHKDLLWAKVIDYRLKNEKLFENISIDDRENIPEIAQRLLGNPFRRLISELQVIVELPNQNEED